MLNRPEYFDIHSHLNFSQYDADREEVIRKMKEEKVWTITVGVNLETSREAVALAQKHEGIFATIGVHPDDLPSEALAKEDRLQHSDCRAYFKEQDILYSFLPHLSRVN